MQREEEDEDEDWKKLESVFPSCGLEFAVFLGCARGRQNERGGHSQGPEISSSAQAEGNRWRPQTWLFRRRFDVYAEINVDLSLSFLPWIYFS